MRPAQAGFALVTALLALLLVTAIAMGMVLMANTETSIALNFRDQQLATAAARAGLEEVRDRLRVTATNSLRTSIPTNLPAAYHGVLYVTSGTAQPWNSGSTYGDTEICNEDVSCASLSGTWYRSSTASTTYAATPVLPWRWVRVMAKTNNAAGGLSARYSVDGAAGKKRVCWTGSSEAATSATDCFSPLQQVYGVTALAVTALGSRRLLQMELAHDPPLGLVGVDLPGAVILDSTGTITCPAGNPLIDGIDRNPNAPASAGIAGVAISGSTSGCNLGSNVSGAPPYTSTPSIYNLTMPASLTPGTGLSSTINTIVSLADSTFTGNPPVGTNVGSCTGGNGDRQIVVVNSPPSTLSALNGCGLLLVRTSSSFSIPAGFRWRGVVIIDASANISVTILGGSGLIYGALIITSGTGNSIALDMSSGGLANGIIYDSRYINYMFGKPLRLIAFREVIN